MPKDNRLDQLRDIFLMLESMYKAAGEQKFMENLGRLADPDDAHVQRAVTASAFTQAWKLPVSAAELLLDFQALYEIFKNPDLDLKRFLRNMQYQGDEELLDFDMRKNDTDWVKNEFLPIVTGA